MEATLLSPDTWTPLTAEEIAKEPRIAYFGPNLSHLDLGEVNFEAIIGF